MCELNEVDRVALRTCAGLAWARRGELTDGEVEQLLIAWMAVGSDAEGQAASELLAARRQIEAQQLKFTELLGKGGGA
jgi:hypothetical protein